MLDAGSCKGACAQFSSNQPLVHITIDEDAVSPNSREQQGFYRPGWDCILRQLITNPIICIVECHILMKYNFQQRISWLSHRWRTQRNAISNVNCRIQWIIESLNAPCAPWYSEEHACLSVMKLSIPSHLWEWLGFGGFLLVLRSAPLECISWAYARCNSVIIPFHWCDLHEWSASNRLVHETLMGSFGLWSLWPQIR